MLKAKAVQDADMRVQRMQDEVEIRVEEANLLKKANVEQRLKIECLETREEGLLADIRKLEAQLKET